MKQSTDQKIDELRKREAQLKARRQALEAQAAKDLKQLVTRQLVVIGEAALAWMAENDAARAVLPIRLRPFIAERDWRIVEPLMKNGGGNVAGDQNG